MPDDRDDPKLDSLLDPEDVNSPPAKPLLDPNDIVPVPVAMSPAEVDERAKTVEALRDKKKPGRRREDADRMGDNGSEGEGEGR